MKGFDFDCCTFGMEMNGIQEEDGDMSEAQGMETQTVMQEGRQEHHQHRHKETAHVGYLQKGGEGSKGNAPIPRRTV